MGDIPSHAPALSTADSTLTGPSNSTSENSDVQPVDTNDTLDTISYVEGDESLSIRLFLQDLDRDCRRTNSRYPSCVRRPWPGELKINTRAGVPIAFVMPNTNEPLNASRWSIRTPGADFKYGTIIIVQQRSDSESEEKFNGGKPTIVVPTMTDLGKRVIWRKWEPKSLILSDSEQLEKLHGPGMTIHRTKKSDSGYLQSIRCTPNDRDRSTDSDETQARSSDQSDGIRMDQNSYYSMSLQGNKRRQSDLTTPSESTENEGYSSDRPLAKVKRQNPSSLPPPPTLPPSTPNLPTTQSTLPAEIRFVFSESTLDANLTHIPLAKINNNMQLFQYAVACGVATKSTTMLGATFNGSTTYVMRNVDGFFKALVVRVKADPVPDTGSQHAPARKDVFITTFLWEN